MGHVYVFSNPSMPGIVKIGCTDRSPSERIAELSAATGVPTPFVLELAVFFADHVEIEDSLHTILEEHRVSGAREFFALPVEVACTKLREQQLDKLVEEIGELSEGDRSALLRKLPFSAGSWTAAQEDLDTAIRGFRKWDDLSLMKLVDAIFSARPAVRKALR